MFRLILLLGWLPGVFAGGGPESAIILKNTLAVARKNEPVVISRVDFEKRFGAEDPTQVTVLKIDERLIPSQLDDLNGDGKWDELAFTVDMEARSALKVEVIRLPEAMAPVFEKRTQVFLAEDNKDGTFSEVVEAVAPIGLDGFPTKYQSEGIGWENDKMAFRIYFDCRNTKDLFGKLTPELILHQAGTPALGSYHELAPWGMDILHCGSSLGAGSLAMVENDSLFRLGSTPVYQYKKISEGPVRTIFELSYQGWTVNGRMQEAVERITLWIGKYWFQSEVTIHGFTGEKQVATGIVTTKLDTEPIHYQPNANYSALLTHGKQSLNSDILAMAVLSHTTDFLKTGRTGNTDYFKQGYRTVPEKNFSQVISETCYLTQKIYSGKPVVHYFFALWGLENPRWNEPEPVKEYIRQEADKLGHPLTVEY